MTKRYIILQGGAVVQCKDLITWAEWMENTDRTVARDVIGNKHVSTVFLGIDHSFGAPNARPILFETMLFEKDNFSDLYCARYATFDEAKAGHKAAVEKVRRGEI